MCFRTLPVLFLLGVMAVSAHPADRTQDVTPEDYFSLATITQFAVAPDGRHVAYCEGRWQQSTDDRKTDLWVVGTGIFSQPTRITFDRANVRNPKWAVDSRTVYFLANRKREAEKKPPYDGTTQVWRIRVVPIVNRDLAPETAQLSDDNAPHPVTQVEGGVTGYDLAPHSGQLFYTTDSSTTDDDPFTSLRTKHTKLDYGHGKRKVSELWRLDLKSWRTEHVISDKRYIREFAVTTDGKRVAMVTVRDDTVLRSEGESRVDVWVSDTNKLTTPDTKPYRAGAASPHAWLEELAWSSDGTSLAFCAIFDAFPAEVIECRIRDGAWATRRLERPDGFHVHGYGSPLKQRVGIGMLALCEKAGQVAAIPYFSGGTRLDINVTKPNLIAHGLDFDEAGENAVLLLGGADRFPDLYALELRRGSEPRPRADLRRLTNLNAHTANWTLPTIKHITWKSKDGTEVGGVLELPAAHKSGEKLPLVVAIHGGPTSSVKTELSFDPHNGRLYFAANGYAVLCPNYRGSTGYGDKFVTDLIGNENDIDVSDIVAGVKHLIDKGIADPERVAVMGWSNGGYLTNCLITRKDLPFKLKAASSGAGILDTAMEWGTNDEPAYPMVFKKGHPWQTPEVYRKTSPSWDLGNVTTPTLIHVGGNDERCPPGHSRMLYRALKEYVGVPAELVVYPGEPHGLTKYSNRKAKMEWDLAWFEKYVKGKKE